jgi:L-lactate utilization protein LutB
MGNKERLKGILERLAAAAERERLDEEEASAKAEKVRSVRVEVIQKWSEQGSHLESYIDEINKQISKNGVQLFGGAKSETCSHRGENGSGQNGGRIPSTHST